MGQRKGMAGQDCPRLYFFPFLVSFLCLLFYFFFCPSFPLSLSFVPSGCWGNGRPTMTGFVGLGHDMAYL